MSEQKCPSCGGYGATQECCGMGSDECCGEPVIIQCQICNATGVIEVEDE